MRKNKTMLLTPETIKTLLNYMNPLRNHTLQQTVPHEITLEKRIMVNSLSFS